MLGAKHRDAQSGSARRTETIAGAGSNAVGPALLGSALTLARNAARHRTALI